MYRRTRSGVAVVDVLGIMTKYGSGLSDFPGTWAVRSLVRRAKNDRMARAILLRIDSPGGSVAGVGALADEVAAAARVKPLTAYIEDQGTDAAYIVASQAGRLVAGPDALVGGIGVFAVVTDLSAAAAQEGAKVHVIRAGAFKGAGVEGTVVTPVQIANWQRQVNQIAAVMLARVARGRGWSAAQAAALADGRSHVGAAALELGLVDGIESFDAALADLERRVVNQQPIKARPTKSGPVQRPGAAPGAAVDADADDVCDVLPAASPYIWGSAYRLTASAPDAESDCAGADDDGTGRRSAAPELSALAKEGAAFRERLIEAGATREQARAAWIGELERRNAVLAGGGDASPAEIAMQADVEWERDPALRAEFSSSRAAYVHYRIALAAGQTRTYDRTAVRWAS